MIEVDDKSDDDIIYDYDNEDDHEDIKDDIATEATDYDDTYDY
jgi:hypothetical protein